MYTETRNNFSLRNVILQFLFIALLVFILIWLFPTKKDMNKATKNSSNDEKITINNNDLSILYDRIFNENLMSMKEAAQSYYTTERLPQKVGDSTKITLREMLDKKIILPFKDKNGKQCDLDASYVQITKKDNEFVMKVNLKCGEEENYLLTYMGCYDYCSKTICEKKGYVGKVYNVPKTTIPKKNICKVINGKYYDNKGNVVSKTSYEKSCNGKKEEVKKYYCKVVNGKYYDNKGNVVSKASYEKACIETPNVEKPHYCEIYNGKYYDVTGKVVSEKEYKDSCEEKEVKYKYLYEYEKIIEGEYRYSEWSEWGSTIITPSSTVEVQQKTQQVKKLKGYNVTVEDDLSKPITSMQTVVISSKNVTSCAKYNLTTTVNDYELKYIGRQAFTSAPKETTEYTYRRVAGDYNWRCDGACVAGTVLLYDVYQRVPKTSSSYSCAEYKTNKTVYTAQQMVVTGYEKKTTRVPVYENLTRIYYRSRTKSKTASSSIKTWSTYNNTELLSLNYHYTGNVKIEMISE